MHIYTRCCSLLIKVNARYSPLIAANRRYASLFAAIRRSAALFAAKYVPPVAAIRC